MSTIAEIEWESCVLDPATDPDLERFVRKALGMVPSMGPYYYPAPWIVRSMVGFDESHVPFRHLGSDLNHLIQLVVSQDNSCRYCYAASRMLLRVTGIPESRILQMEGDLLRADLSRRERLALELARRISRANPMADRDELAPLLASGLESEFIKEIVFAAAVAIFFNRLATLPAIPSADMERMANQWFLPLLRPVVALMRRRRAPHEAENDPWRGPYAYLTDAFGDSAARPAIARPLRGAWESSLLTPRTKALAFAVVARGLACPISEREATRVLAEEGLPGEVVADALAHLTSPALDAKENAILPFARETIWYRPAHVQRRAREIRGILTASEFVELVGILSLANAVCRMNVVLALDPP